MPALSLQFPLDLGRDEMAEAAGAHLRLGMPSRSTMFSVVKR
jgi:hypothetical protein